MKARSFDQRFHLPPPPSCRIAPTAKIHPNVRLGENVVVEDYCVIGYPPNTASGAPAETAVGDGTRIRTHCIIYAGVRIGRSCHIGHTALIREHTTLGDGVSIGINALIEHHAEIGDRVRIQGRVGIGEHTIIESDAWIGPAVVTTNALHPTCERAKECLSGPIIRSGAIVGAGVIISPDVEIGVRAFVGSGSVVIKTVPDEAVMFGVPARRMGTVRRLTCPYDLLESGMSPYDPARARPAARVKLVDLAAQHQALKQDVRLAMDRVILNGRFAAGKEIGTFETNFARLTGIAHVRAVASETRALWLALVALEIGAGDEVVTAGYDDPVVAEAIRLCGAAPVFAGIDRNDLVISLESVTERLTPRTRAIVATDLFGAPAPVAALRRLADRHALRLVQRAGPAAAPDLASDADCVCFSFAPGATLSGYGAAGAVATHDPALAERIGALRDRGLPGRFPADSALDTLQAGILDAKLRHVADWAERRRGIAAWYRAGLAGLPLAIPSNDAHRWQSFVVGSAARDRLLAHLAADGIDAAVPHPVVLDPALAPEAERLLALPMYPELSSAQVDRVIASVRRCFV